VTATAWSIGSVFTAVEGQTIVTPDSNGCSWYVETVKGWHGSPAPRTNTVPKEQSDGDFDGPTFQPGRVVSIDGWVEAPTQVALFQAMDQLAALLVAGNRTDVLLGAEAYLSRQMTVRRDGETLITPISATSADYSLLLYASDPAKYSATLNHSTTGVYSSGNGITYPKAYPTTYGDIGTQGFATIHNAGNLDAYPVLTVTTPVSPLVNPVFRLVGGAALIFNLTLAAGDFLTIDTGQQTVLLNGVASRYTSLSAGSDFFSCPPGDSQILFTADSGDTSALLDVSWRDPYA
jgi:hypothetical protein